MKENYRNEELLKSFRKEAKESKEKSDKSSRRQEKKIRELMRFKTRKLSEESELGKADQKAALGKKVPENKPDKDGFKNDVHSEPLQTRTVDVEEAAIAEEPFECDTKAKDTIMNEGEQ